MSNSSSSHWLIQRFSAIFLIFLSIVFSYKIFNFITADTKILTILSEPFTILLFFSFIAMAFYHSAMGIEVILEDYVNCNAKRQFINFLLKCINISTIIFLLIAIIFGYQQNFHLEKKNHQENQAQVSK
jgi:succinate dehydrogenase / fumarate reductase membrane anchor subunit